MPEASEAALLLDRFLEAVRPEADPNDDLSETPAAQALRQASAEVRLAAVREGLRRLGTLKREVGDALGPERASAEGRAQHLAYVRLCHLNALLGRLVERQLPWTREALLEVLRAIPGEDGGSIFHEGSGPTPCLVPALVKQVQKLTGGEALDLELREALSCMRESAAHLWWFGGFKKSLASLDGLLAQVEAGLPEPGEAWTDAVHRDVAGMEPAAREAWKALFLHGAVSNKHEPSAKWLAAAPALLAPVEGSFDRCLTGWLDAVGRGAQAAASDGNADYLKGLFWYAALRSNGELATAVANATEGCLKKLPGGGLYCSRAVKPALYALERLPGDAAAPQLVRLKLRVKSPWGLELIEQSLKAVVERLGMAAEDVEEVSIPDYGLQGDGSLIQQFGEARGELRIAHTGGVELAWFAGGKAVKSVPSAAVKAYADEVKALKRAAADLEKMLAAQRMRLERLCLAPRSWSYAEWSVRYLEHPVVGSLARRLIWQVGPEPAVWCEEGFQGRDGRRLTPAADAVVTLWHPLASPADDVLAWRVWLEERGVVQPFKQAHREVYLLTDAERETSVYSNRFAGHILRQHQAAALARERGWEFEYAGTWDSGAAGGRLRLPDGLTAEFVIDSAGGGEDAADSGVLLIVSTDRVSFHRRGQPVPLDRIPPRVFSEVMRDVDLFVGVASIGNDPEWRDRPAREGATAYDEYWQSYSFGELSMAAVLRRDLLRRLLPKLKIADRCELEERFLRVRGDRRTYRIHLRSGNILMEPHDQYLCIVPGKDPDRGVFLPFEGDRTLAVILSKAFLLADDARITDPTILRQIGA